MAKFAIEDTLTHPPTPKRWHIWMLAQKCQIFFFLDYAIVLSQFNLTPVLCYYARSFSFIHLKVGHPKALSRDKGSVGNPLKTGVE